MAHHCPESLRPENGLGPGAARLAAGRMNDNVMILACIGMLAFLALVFGVMTFLGVR